MIRKTFQAVRASYAFKAASAAFILLVAAASSQLSNAAAARAEEPLTVVVRYGDLNLRHAPDAARLYARIRSAARQACAPLDSRDLLRKSAWIHCVDGAVSRAVFDVHDASLTAYHHAKTRAADSTAALAGISH
jgi:UrcA family protein